jgi:hypothetical protein
MGYFKHFLLAIVSFLCFNAKSQQISILGQWPNNPNFLCKYTQNRLIVTTVGGIRFLDVSNPTNPIATSALISNPPNGEFSFAIELSGNYAYFAGSYFGHFRIVDISNLNNPVQTGITFGVLGTAYQIAIRGNYAFVPTNNDTLYSVDISNKMNPTVLSKLYLGSFPNGITVNGNYAYVSTPAGIKIINVTNPSSMSVVSTFGSAYYGKISSDLGNNRIFISNGPSGFDVVDISNPTSLSILYHPIGGGGGDITYNNGKIFQNSITSAYEVNSNSGNFLCSLADPLSGQVNGIDSKDSIFYVSTTNFVYALKYSSLNTVTSLKNLDQLTDISFFPCPANDYINIKTDNSVISKIIIYNSLGAITKELEDLNDISHKIDISNLPHGMYFMSMFTENGKKQLKFIKD